VVDNATSGSGLSSIPADPLFLDPTLDWQPVSPRLVTERRLPWLVLLLAAVALLVLAVGSEPGVGRTILVILAPTCVVVWALAWFMLVPRLSTSWRYAERDQDLLIRRGRVNRRLTIVPYGRMQVIEVSANPVSQRLGIATVTLVTASASTDARIPGVPTDVAHALRDRLAAKGEASAAGL
jgi:membrane protein YdbS with pleckstrin-like domain